MKTLIIIPPINHIGGVSGHFRGLKQYWKKNIIYFERYGKHQNKLINYFIYPVNVLRFLIALHSVKPHKVIVNVSLTAGFFSNILYANISCFFNRRTIVFFHGWDSKNENWIDIIRIKKMLNKTEHILVLSKQFKNVLIEKNITTPISLTTTKVSDEMIEGFNVNNKKGRVNNLLFVSRVEKNKGIYIALDVFLELYKKDESMTFTIVGDGTELNTIRLKVKEEKIKNVFIKGKLFGSDLRNVFEESDLFLLLTSHKEGLPAALLEAMAYGLPVITRPMGAIGEIFNESMGVISDSLSPSFFAQAILNLKKNEEIVREMSINNYSFIQEKYLSSVVTNDLEQKLKL